ncbi:MAG: hypothetical protein U0136_16255 [Bdellovibrionota bacterium]
MFAAALRKLFQIAEGEGRKVLAFAVLGGLIQAGLAVGMSTADSLFLTKLGAAKLPMIFIATPVLMIVYVPIYSMLLHRLGNERTVQLSLVVLALCGGLLGTSFTLIEDSKFVELSYYAVKLFTVFWYIALYTLYWNFVDGYFDILDGKRLFSLLAAGSALGAAIGGAAVSVLSEFISTQTIFFAWPVLALAALPALHICKTRWTKLENDGDEDVKRLSAREQTKQLFTHFKGSRFAILLAATLFLVMNVTLVCEYQYFNVLSRHRSEAELTKLFGELFLGVNLLNLFINGFLFQRLVSWLGVRNVSLIQPVSYFLVFVLFLIDDSTIAGLAGFVAYQGLLTSIDFNNSNLLMNALPAAGKKSLRACIEGLCEPLAHAVTGVFLLCVVKLLQPEQISAIGLGLSVLTLLFVFMMRSAYVGAMVTNLKQGWLDFSRSSEVILQKLNEDDEAALKARLSDAVSSHSFGPEFFLSTTLLARLDPAWALRAVTPVLGTLNPEQAEQIGPVICRLLEAADPSITREFLSWLESSESELFPELIEHLADARIIHTSSVGVERYKEWLQSPSLSRKTAGAAVLQSSNDLQLVIEPLEIAKQLAGGTDEERRAAIRLINHFGSAQLIHPLVAFLAHSSPALQHDVLRTILELATADSHGLVRPMLRELPKFAESERLLVLDIIEKIGDTETALQLLKSSHGFAPKERRKLEAIITNLGLKAIPIVVTALRSKDLSRRARSIAARCLAKLSFAQLDSIAESLIEAEIERAYDCVARYEVLASTARDSSGIRVLKRIYTDTKRGTLNFVLELLSLSGRVASFELLSARLRSVQPKERANAIETIQQACNRDVFKLLLPLLDPRVKIRNNDKQLSPTVHEVLERSLREHSGVEGAAAAQALYELSGEVAKPLLLATLRLEPKSPRGETILALLSRDSTLELKVQGNPSARNLVERLDLLAQASFFRQFNVDDLCALDARGTQFAIEAGTSIDGVAENLYIVEQGCVTGADQQLERGAIFGIETSGMTAGGYRADSDLICYRYPKASLLELAAGSVGVATSLFAAKHGVSHES